MASYIEAPGARLKIVPILGDKSAQLDNALSSKGSSQQLKALRSEAKLQRTSSLQKIAARREDLMFRKKVAVKTRASHEKSWNTSTHPLPDHAWVDTDMSNSKWADCNNKAYNRVTGSPQQPRQQRARPWATTDMGFKTFGAAPMKEVPLHTKRSVLRNLDSLLRRGRRDLAAMPTTTLRLEATAGKARADLAELQRERDALAASIAKAEAADAASKARSLSSVGGSVIANRKPVA